MSDAATSERTDGRVMRGVIPYLSLDRQAGEAADFYARAFGARDLGRMPDPEKPGRLMHVQIEINGGALMMTDHRSEGGVRPPFCPMGIYSSSSTTAEPGGTARSPQAAPS
jgi:PhnB protein